MNRKAVVLPLLSLVLGAGAWLAGSPVSSAERTVKVTLREGTNLAPALSPDGKLIAFSLQSRLWIMPSSGGTARAITDELLGAEQPAWSPDGRILVFQGYGASDWDIYTITPDGQNLRRLTQSPYDEREPAFSPDGKSIVFSSDRSGNYDIWVMSADGTGTPRQLSEAAEDDYMPAWSPDGSRIAFVSDRDGAPALYVTSSNSLAPATRVIPKAADPSLIFSVNSPSWSPNGQSIAFTAAYRCRYGQRFLCDAMALKTVNLATGQLADRSQIDEDVFPFRASWLPGDALLYGGNGHIQRTDSAPVPFQAELDLRRPVYRRTARLLEGSGARPVQGIIRPQISPDGKQVAFSALGHLWLTSAVRGGGAARQLTRGSSVDLDPTWSPDGKRLAFASDRGGRFEIWEHDLTRATVRKLASVAGDATSPAWSPDGKLIALIVDRGHMLPSELDLVDVAAGTTRTLRPGLVQPGGPTWLSDSRHVSVPVLHSASSRYREGWNEDMIVALDGTTAFLAPRPAVSMDARSFGGPVWSPDGRWAAFLEDSALWLLPVGPAGRATGEPRKINDELSHSPSWAADSKSLVLMSDDRLKRVTVDGRLTDLQPKLSWRVAPPPAVKRTIWAGRLWDGEQEGYRRDVDIVVNGNRISAVRPHGSAPIEGVLIDASQATVIPGMIESHAHMSDYDGERLGRTVLAYGITSVREPAADPYDAVSRREIWGSGQLAGPRVFTSGPILDGSRIFYNSAHPVGQRLDREFGRFDRLGFDLAKTYVRLPNPMQSALLAKAHERGIPLTSHELYPAVGIGVDSVEHLRGTSRQGYSLKESERGYAYDDVITLLTQGGMFVSPTIGAPGGLAYFVLRNPALLQNRQFLALYRADERESVKQMVEARRPQLVDLTRYESANARTLRDIVAKGGRIAAGTDSPIVPFGWGYAIELQLYAAAGLSGEQVLRAATIWPATLLAVDDRLGSVKVGKLADMVIVAGDPLASTADLMNVSGVMADGHYHPIDELLRAPRP